MDSGPPRPDITVILSLIKQDWSLMLIGIAYELGLKLIGALSSCTYQFAIRWMSFMRDSATKLISCRRGSFASLMLARPGPRARWQWLARSTMTSEMAFISPCRDDPQGEPSFFQRRLKMNQNQLMIRKHGVTTLRDKTQTKREKAWSECCVRCSMS